MEEDFQQTVNLKSKVAKPKARPTIKTAPKVEKKIPKTRAEEISEVYGENDEDYKEESFRKINQPQVKQVKSNVIRNIFLVLFFCVILVIVYFAFFQGDKSGKVLGTQQAVDWYAVKLINGEVYYGQISDTSADPVIIENVYYNYDQIKSDGTPPPSQNETGNIRLVKRGQETHGPAGSMDVVRAQVVYMEPLKDDSKVLRAILNYEK